MSRNTGIFNFAANFEGLLKAPIDARQLVATKADLTGVTTWCRGDGNVWLYDGAIVSVANDSNTSNNGIYFLKNAANYSDINSWIKVGDGIGTITGGTNGLSNSGANIILGGNLLSGTTINGSGHYLSISNIGEFNVSTLSNSTILGIDNNGLMFNFSGGSLLFEDNKGLKYNGIDISNFVDDSLVNKKYVDIVASGLQPKSAVFVATTGNTTLSGSPKVIDGISVDNGTRVLVKDQTNPVENGVYVVSDGTWQRSSDFDGTPQGEIKQGALIPVITGNSQHNTLWVLITPDPITGGTTPLTFTLFTKATDLQAGIGIDIAANIISVNGNSLAGNYIIWSGNTFNVNKNAITSGYTTLSQFNSYTGNTENRLIGIENNITYISGITNNKLDISLFTGYSANTNIRISNIENDIISLSGISNTKLSISTFTGYTANTNTRISNIENDISYISGITDTKLNSTVFISYTGTTQPILDTALTGATNGLYYNNRVVKLGGVLTENTTIGLINNTLEFSGTSIQYSADYSESYNIRSIPDVEYVTAYTKNAITINSNVLNVTDVSDITYTATIYDDFISVSGGSLVYLPSDPKMGQRIVVADVGGNALLYPITINGNGKNILDSNIATINTNYGSITFIYNTKGFWSTVAFIN